MNKIIGGQATQRFISDAMKAQASGVRSIEIGYYSGDRYPDGTPVTTVATAHEFGHGKAPARPFIRQAIRSSQAALTEVLVDGLDGDTMTIDEALAQRIGGVVKRAIRRTIRRGAFAKNAPTTLARKSGRKPLTETGKLGRAIRVRTIR